MAGLEINGAALVAGTVLQAWFRILVAKQAVGLNLRRIELHLDSDISGDDRAAFAAGCSRALRQCAPGDEAAPTRGADSRETAIGSLSSGFGAV